jgi:hypothetical protein
MTPSQVRAYLRERGQASLVDLAAHFDTDPQHLEAVLALWEQKGKVRKTLAACGKGCSGCSIAPAVFYTWQEQPECPSTT